MPHHLFVVEDDAELRDMLGDFLESRGHVVTRLRSGEELLQRSRELRPDLVVLDVGLPGISGFDACRSLSLRGDAPPVILLTGRTDEVDRLIGFELGADDYLGKPFSPRELLARVRAVLRRCGGAGVADGVADGAAAAPVRLGEQVFDPASRSLLRGADSRPLSALEFLLLRELVARPGVPLTREQLLQATHAADEPPLLRTIDTAVMRLRRLIEPEPARPRYIQTVRGVGYVFVPSLSPLPTV